MEENLINEPCKKDEKTKQKFTDALQHCLDLMNKNNNIHKNYIKYSSNNILTQKSAIVGHKMYEFFKETINELMIKKEMIEPDTETINKLMIKEEIIEPDTEKIELKRVSVKLERLDPDVIKNLTIKKNKLRYREKCIDKDVNVTDEIKKINNWVFTKCVLYKKRKKNLSNKLIKKWGLEAKNIMLSNDNKHTKISFAAGHTWLNNFKKKYNIIKGRNRSKLQIVDKKTIDRTITGHSTYSIIPYDTKLKLIITKRKHPNWTLDMVKKHCGYRQELKPYYLNKWIKQLKKGGTPVDQMETINNWVYQKCIEHKKNNNQLKNENIRQFGRQAYEDCFPNKKNRLIFTASYPWIHKFKKSFGIVGRSPNLIITDKSINDETPDMTESPNLLIKNELINDEISDTTEAPSEESPVAEDESDESSVESNDKKSHVTYDDKIRVIKLARDNPTWTAAMLRQASGVKTFKTISTLESWKKQVANGGSVFDKSYRLDQWLDNKVNEYKSNNKILTREIIQNLLIEGKKSLNLSNVITKKRGSWWLAFKKKHNFGESFIDNKKNVELQTNIFSRKKQKFDLISPKKKLEIINLVRKNPTWTIRMIQEKSNCYRCQSIGQVKQWITSFKNGGARHKHINIINRHVYRNYIQFKRQNKNITDKDLTTWAQEAIEKYNISYSRNFKLQTNWLERFKRIYCLSVPINPNSQDDDDNDCNLIKSNSSDISNKNYKEINDNTALNLNELDTISIKRSKRIDTPFEVKKKVIDLVRKNPTWSLEDIKKNSGCEYIYGMKQIRFWEKCVEEGGNIHDDWKKLNNLVFEKCLLYKKKEEQLSNELIRKWALEAKDIVFSGDKSHKAISFAAKKDWINGFKRKYNIKGKNPHELQIIDEININDKISDTTEAQSEESPVIKDESDES